MTVVAKQSMRGLIRLEDKFFKRCIEKAKGITIPIGCNFLILREHRSRYIAQFEDSYSHSWNSSLWVNKVLRII